MTGRVATCRGAPRAAATPARGGGPGREPPRLPRLRARGANGSGGRQLGAASSGSSSAPSPGPGRGAVRGTQLNPPPRGAVRQRGAGPAPRPRGARGATMAGGPPPRPPLG